MAHIRKAQTLEEAKASLTNDRLIVLGVVGSRSFSDRRLMERILGEFSGRITSLVSGGADGADKMAAKWARRQGIATQIFEPDHKTYKHAFHHRNRLIVEASDLLVAFWNGRSTGTAYTIGYAKRLNVPVKIVKF